MSKTEGRGGNRQLENSNLQRVMKAKYEGLSSGVRCPGKCPISQRNLTKTILRSKKSQGISHQGGIWNGGDVGQ